MLDGVLPWLVGRAIPFIIFVGLLLDLGLFRGTAGKNRFGAAALPVRYKPATYQ